MYSLAVDITFGHLSCSIQMKTGSSGTVEERGTGAHEACHGKLMGDSSYIVPLRESMVPVHRAHSPFTTCSVHMYGVRLK